MKVNFYSKSILSLLDLTTIGGSDKLGDETKIGQFCSGLKYALALFLRNDVKFTATTRQTVYDLGGFDRMVTTFYSIDKHVKEDEFAGHSKELICINAGYEYQSFHTALTNDEFCEDVPTDEVYETGISTELGFDWKLEYALREIWSNMIDEDGWYDENDKPDENHKIGTVISLEFDDNSPFYNIWKDRELYFITTNRKPIIEFERYSQKVQVFKNESITNVFKDVQNHKELFKSIEDDKKFRIYKQGILVYEDKSEHLKSDISFNINFGKLDERRILLDLSSVLATITSIFINANTEEQIDFMYSGIECDALSANYVSWSNLGQEMIDAAFIRQDIKSFPCVMELLRKLDNSPLQDRKISTIKDSIWSAQKEVTVKETAKEISEKETLPIYSVGNGLSLKTTVDESKQTIQDKIPFEIQFPIKEATIVGSVVVADKFNKVILINSEFDLNNDKHLMEFIIQYFDLTNNGKGNIVHKLANFILKPHELE